MTICKRGPEEDAQAIAALRYGGSMTTTEVCAATTIGGPGDFGMVRTYEVLKRLQKRGVVTSSSYGHGSRPVVWTLRAVEAEGQP